MVEDTQGSAVEAASLEKYKAGGTGVCPYCGDSSIDGEEQEIEGDQVWQHCSCNVCGRGWTDVYSHTDVETDDGHWHKIGGDR